MRRHLAVACFLLLVLEAPGGALADRWVLRDPHGQELSLDGRLIGSTPDLHVLELADGQYHLAPRQSVVRREETAGPKALDAAGVLALIEKQMGAKRIRGIAQEPYAVALLAAWPLPPAAEGRASAFVRHVAGFLKNVDVAFGRFLKDARIVAQPPSFPLVVLVYEGLDDFSQYAAQIAGTTPSAAQNIGGFYSPRTNFLAVRLEECRTFEVVLHEAIHQQSYNRQLFRRLAPVPMWFDEGIATGFEGNQGRIQLGPGKISARYAHQALAARQLDWKRIIEDDAVFHDEKTASDAYGLAWGLHWLSFTRYRAEYGRYLRLLSEKKPLAADSPQQRIDDFRTAFGREPQALQKEFRQALESGMKRQKVPSESPPPVGTVQASEGLGDVKLTALRHVQAGQGGPRRRLEVQGVLTNLSPLRPMAFYVSIQTDAGTYADWFVPSVEIGKTVSLPAQIVVKSMPIRDASGHLQSGPPVPAAAGDHLHLRIRSAAADSAQAKRWARGEVPVPVAGEG